MSTSGSRAGEQVVAVSFSEHAICVDLADGRTISAPLAWYPRLLHATPEQRADWQIAGGGYGIHWPSQITLDTGALIALERRKQRAVGLLKAAVQRGLSITVPAVVVAEWWRERTAWRTRLLDTEGLVVEPLTEEIAVQAGEALARVPGATTIGAIV